jgi:hypothetical protein
VVCRQKPLKHVVIVLEKMAHDPVGLIHKVPRSSQRLAVFLSGNL